MSNSIINYKYPNYHTLYTKKFKLDDDPNTKYIFKFWRINDFILYCYNNKFIYDSIIKFIKRYDGFNVFFYLFLKKIDHNDNIYILTMENYEEETDNILLIKNFVGFFSVFYDIEKKYCFAEHFLINPDYRGKGLCKIMVKYWNKYYTKIHTMPVYGAVFKSNEAALKCFESGNYNIINEMKKHNDKIVVIGFDPLKYINPNYNGPSYIDKDFDIKKVFSEYSVSYNPLFEKKIDKDNKHYLLKFWNLNDFILYCYHNKSIYLHIDNNIIRNDNFSVFFYFHLKLLNKETTYIITIEEYENYPKITNFLGFMTCIINIDQGISLLEHIYINNQYDFLLHKMIKHWNKFYSHLYRYSIYSLSNHELLLSNHYISNNNILTFDPIEYLKSKNKN